MRKNKLIGMLTLPVLLLCVSCSKDNDEIFRPGINDLSAEMQGWVRKYPGEVGGEITRLNNIQVSVSGASTVPGEGVVQARPLCWQSSGLYVPPAEEITVEVPAGTAGLNYQIGIAKVELSASEQKKRYHQVSRNGKLQPGLNSLKTDFGGPLYFYFDEGTPSGNVAVKVSGAIKSNDFVSGETSVAEWRQGIDLSPWSELIGKRVIFTLPAATLKKIENPQAFLDFYDEFFEKDVEKLQVVASGEIAAPWRIYADVQLPADKDRIAPILLSSYPMAFVVNQLEETVTGLPRFEGERMTEWLAGMADLYQVSPYSEEMKPIVKEMFAWHLLQRKSQWDALGVQMAQPKKETERYWMARENDRRTMFLQLLQQYGWGMMVYSKKRSNEEMPFRVSDQYGNDLLAIYASEYANADLTDFFNDWNFPVSMYARQYMKHYPAVQERFWDMPDQAKQPGQSSETPAGIAYEKIIPVQDTIYTGCPYWSIKAGSESAQGNGNGPAACLLDGRLDTYYHSGEASHYPHSIACTFKDNAGESMELEFNYLKLAQRNHINPGPGSFRVLIKPTPSEDDDWIEIEEGRVSYLQRDYDFVLGNIFQFCFLGQSYKAFGIKLEFLSSLPGHEGGNDMAAYMTLAEMELGLLK